MDMYEPLSDIKSASNGHVLQANMFFNSSLVMGSLENTRVDPRFRMVCQRGFEIWMGADGC
jgi:hypothetical protein